MSSVVNSAMRGHAFRVLTVFRNDHLACQVARSVADSRRYCEALSVDVRRGRQNIALEYEIKSLKIFEKVRRNLVEIHGRSPTSRNDERFVPKVRDFVETVAAV